MPDFKSYYGAVHVGLQLKLGDWLGLKTETVKIFL